MSRGNNPGDQKICNTGTNCADSARSNTLNNSSCVVILFDQRFQSTKTPVFVRNILNNRFASYFLFSHKDLIKYFSAKSHHWLISINWRHSYIINSKEYVIDNMYNQYSFRYKC